MSDRDRTHRAMHGSLECPHDVALVVPAAFGSKIFFRKGPSTSKTAGLASAGGAEKLLEEITETGAAKMEFVFFAARAAPRLGTSAAEGFPTRRRTEFASGFPVGTQLIIFFALGGIAQNFVGLVNLFEFFLGLLFI